MTCASLKFVAFQVRNNWKSYKFEGTKFDDLVLEKSKFKAIADEMDQTVADLVGY
ncbi:hypothetical protein HUJ05_011365 [Dendroctonus ponderosae]|nr:hypothetical protein HUJ05_011365 [Dendroctonus ponderosae]